MSWAPFILFAAILLGLNDVAAKKAFRKEHASAFLSASSVIIALFSLLLLLTGKIEPISGSMIILILLKSIFASLYFTLCMMALHHLDISEFAPLMNISPVFLLFISVIFLNEKITIIQLSGIALIIIGAYILELKDGWESPLKRIKNSKHIHLLFLGMIFASLAAATDRYILIQPINLETFYLYQRIFIAIMLCGISAIFYNGYKDVVKAYKRSFVWILIPSLLYLAGDYFYLAAVAVPTAMISLIIPVKRMSNLVATIVGGEFFGEKNLLRKTIGCIIMLAGVFLIIYLQ